MVSNLNEDIITRATDTFGTPFYLYSVEGVKENIRRLMNTFPCQFELALSLKANPNPHLLANLNNNIDWLDIASIGELYIAQLAGIPMSKLMFIGPGKTRTDIDIAIKKGIGLIVVESIDELRLVEQISWENSTSTDILIRINPIASFTVTDIQMSGCSSQFGIDEEQLINTLPMLKILKHVVLKGIHVYMGSQILDADQIYYNFKNILRLANSLFYDQGVELSIVDFGGGFGVPYFEHEQVIDLESLGENLVRLFDIEAKGLLENGCRFIIESGRYLFADAGVFVVQVVYKKESMGSHYLVLDGGSNYHSTLSGMGKIVRQNFPFTVINRKNHDSKAREYNLVGPLCTPRDMLAKSVFIEVAEVGDLVVFSNSGAYGLTYSQNQFLSHINICELLIKGDDITLIKPKKDIEAFSDEYGIHGSGGEVR